MMASIDFELLKKIDLKTKHAVTGYIRRHRNDYNQQNVPDLIMFIILSYYAIMEYFGVINEAKVKLTEDNTCIKKISEHFWDNTSYGNITINPMKDKGVYKWWIRIEQFVSNAVIGFGTEHESINTSIDNDDGFYYILNCYTGSIQAKGWDRWNDKIYVIDEFNTREFRQRVNVGDILCVEFNIDEKYIKYYLNDKDYGVAFDANDIEINEEIEYKLGVSFYGECRFRLIRFEHQLK